MTEALWLSISVAAVATACLTAASLLLSKRSAARIDRMVAEREAADRQRAAAGNGADRLLKDNLMPDRSEPVILPVLAVSAHNPVRSRFGPILSR